jgi:hypothetical protein
MGFVSGLYEGEVTVADRAHCRRRRAAMLLVDLDDARTLEGLGRHAQLVPARAAVDADLARAGLRRAARVEALCAGGLSASLCADDEGRTIAVRYAVGGRGWAVPLGCAAARVRAADEDGRTYALCLRRTAETAQLVVDAVDAGGRFVFAASFLSRRRRLSWWSRLSARLAAPGLAPRLAEALEAWSAVAPESAEDRLAA